ncbi:G-type lectin S-receptor-like serine/threonine-protein kinase RLK1 [Morella rubra]|uniref:Receptor-like serine/threonine-protein kinase n=1 Tax=Morella rubra TaxID=262757 RepID=A0A6A1W6G8_9ROSI|nr:G-type lectin S-receptor-like serine/threonine-protein kinase RLK1 [Morella rubra]
MVAIVLFLLLINEFPVAIAQQRNSIISLNSSLSPNNNPFWLSGSGLFAFGFYKKDEGFAIGIWLEKVRQKTVLWTANRDDPQLPKDVTLLLTSDGRLVLQQKLGQQIALSNAPQPASSASMLNTGDFVLYNSNSTIIWETVDVPTDTILAGQRLLAGNDLVSSISKANHASGKFRLIMQKDGNLVQYPANSPAAPEYAYWNTKTATAGDNVSLNLDSNGQLYLLNTTGFNIKNLNGPSNLSDNAFYRLTIDPDGILRLYSHSLNQDDDWSIEWLSSSNNCDPIGLCGLNAYCTLMDQEATCVCSPGFAFIDEGQKDLGCHRNFRPDGCKSKNGETFYLSELEGLTWEDNPYSTLASTKIACREDCLKDCYCEAALFKDQQCRKQKLPLRFGRRQQVELGTTLIKVGVASSETTQVSTRIKKHMQKDVLIGSSAILAFALIVLAITAILIHRHRVWEYRKTNKYGNDELIEDVALRSYTYPELEKVTNGFSDELGKGAFGTVFKGVMSNGRRVVAIKRLEKVVAEARGILYLHEECENQIIHCDIKPENILLDEHKCPKVADFGLAKLLRPNQSRTYTGIRGTRGYVAPEWHRDLPITVKADVYSYGIMLLEIICGRRKMETDLSEQKVVLANWVYDCFENSELDKLVEDEEVDKSKLERMVRVGLWCIQEEPSLRPSMKKVVLMLEGTVEIPTPPSPTSFLSCM